MLFFFLRLLCFLFFYCFFDWIVCFLFCFFFFSSRRRHTRCALVTGVQTCALPIYGMAIFAPNANSYRRFKANSYAPQAAVWGVNNRTVSLRVPAGLPHTRHVEHRVAGADANPYLTLAAVLASAHYGIVNKIDPGPPEVGEGYAAARESGQYLTTNWFASGEQFERSGGKGE